MSGAIWLTANLFVIVSAAALARAVASESAPWLLVSLFVGVLGAHLQHRHFNADLARDRLRGEAVAPETA
jgi:hypothetical protein